MKKNLLIAAIAAATLVSCSKDNSVDSDFNGKGNPIDFRTTGDKGDSRASEITSITDLSNFKVWAHWSQSAAGQEYSFMPGIIVEKVNGQWVYSPKKYWPTGGNVHFYAYSPATSLNLTVPALASNFDESIVEYKVPTDNDKQEDLLVAMNETATSAGAMVDLPFIHALSQVVFQARCVAEGITASIHDIHFENMYSEGTCDFTQIVSSYSAGAATSPLWTATGNMTNQYWAQMNGPVVVKYNNASLPTGNDYTNITFNGGADHGAGTGLFLLPQAAVANTDAAFNSDGLFGNPALLDASKRYVAITYSLKDAAGFEYNSNATGAGLLTWYLPVPGDFKVNTRYAYRFDIGGSSNLKEIKFNPSVISWLDGTEVTNTL